MLKNFLFSTELSSCCFCKSNSCWFCCWISTMEAKIFLFFSLVYSVTNHISSKSLLLLSVVRVPNLHHNGYFLPELRMPHQNSYKSFELRIFCHQCYNTVIIHKVFMAEHQTFLHVLKNKFYTYFFYKPSGFILSFIFYSMNLSLT